MKLDISKEWAMAAAEHEGNCEVGAGFETCPAPKLWRHKKRGTVYEILSDKASLQCSAASDFEEMFEGHDWTVYRNIKTGAIWVRPTEEFMDGRFEHVDRS